MEGIDRSSRHVRQRYMPQAPELPLLSLFNPSLSLKSIHSLAKLVIENTGHVGEIHQEISYCPTQICERTTLQPSKLVRRNCFLTVMKISEIQHQHETRGIPTITSPGRNRSYVKTLVRRLASLPPYPWITRRISGLKRRPISFFTLADTCRQLQENDIN